MTGYTRLITYSVSGVLLAGSLFVFVLKPALNRGAELAQEERTSKAELDRLDNQILAYKTAQSDLAKAVQKDMLSSVIVQETDLGIPIEEVEAGAKATGSTYQFKILRDSLSEEQEEGQRRSARAAAAKRVLDQTEYEEVPYTLTVQNSSYTSLISFLKYLEHIPHFTEVSGVDMSWQESDEVPDFVSATINGVFLVKKNENSPQ